ncbi:MAG: PilZ domain-containing protein [Bacteriovoracaceae bacterium]|nr:PilZ domain-containing protein [Bacteriovoracaceae bacterium]
MTSAGSVKHYRKHLRAPLYDNILFEDDNYVFKARTLNISEGGILLDALPHFPAKESVGILVPVPQFPQFKNFSLERLKDYSQELFPKKILPMKVTMVRRETETTSVDDVFRSRIGAAFVSADHQTKKIISDYVDVFVSNIVYLQAILDQVNVDKTSLEKVKVLSHILGYRNLNKIALLRKLVTHDYQNLQW